MKNSLKKRIFFFGLIIGTGILISGFNSCDVYSESNLFAEFESNCVDEGDCEDSSVDIMEIKINTENNYLVASTDTALDVGGECNEGGYGQNVIIWELFLDNTLVASHDSYANENLATSCVQGRFSFRVRLPRAGLATSSTTGAQRREHRLEVELIGFDEKTGEPVKNPLMARKSITLTPL
ncbi:MAG: hypothetical protein KDD35_01655 [Bdellovibrionales bacterium]|nr:hypothetical protein [Bdellovibrionales bacterium]